MLGQHAILSPSAAHRWLHCTAAPLLEKGVEDKGSTFAEEGTLAHAYCAKKLKTFLGISTKSEDKEIVELKGTYHTGEMDECTDAYKVIVLEKFNKARKCTSDAQLLVETRLDFSKYIPEAFGTSDAIIIADGTMEVIDFKYGKGVKVDAENNPQMMIYALGAYELFSFEYDIKKVKMSIIQPRIDNLSECDMSVEALLKWAKRVLTPRAKEAYKGGEQQPGTWCQFCKVKPTCKALADTCVTLVKDTQNLKLVSPADVAENILPMLPVVKTWLSGVEEFTLEQALVGVQYPGFKIVEGRSIRKISEPEKVKAILCENGFNEEVIMKPSELKSITDLEKAVGKKAFAGLCGEYINKPQGKPTLVPDSDKRPVFNSSQDDFKDF